LYYIDEMRIRMDYTIDDLLKEAQQRKASDLHITVGVSPKCRVNGELGDLPYPVLTPSDTEELIIPIVKPNMKEILLTNGEVDFSYSIAGHGRYRVNVFRQRGSYAAAIRIINIDIPSPEVLGLPSSVLSLTKKKREWSWSQGLLEAVRVLHWLP
jgi:twitching motility protein PilT